MVGLVFNLKSWPVDSVDKKKKSYNQDYMIFPWILLGQAVEL